MKALPFLSLLPRCKLFSNQKDSSSVHSQGFTWNIVDAQYIRDEGVAPLPTCSFGVTVRVSHLFLSILIEQQCIFSFGGAALLVCLLICASLLLITIKALTKTT